MLLKKIKETNRTIRKQNTIYNKSKENREKVFTQLFKML